MQPKRQIPFPALGGMFGKDDVEAATRVLNAASRPGGSFFPLPEENDFQNNFARHEGAARAVAVNSCGTALDLCMMALNIGPGDEVIVSPLTFVCTATCAAARGAKVVFADVDRRTLRLDPKAVEAKITARTRAIIPVHLAGLACDVDAFAALADRRGVAVVYDGAHAIGAKSKGRPVGGAGRATCYSFQSNKNMTTMGEGGTVTTDDEDFAETVRRKKTFGFVYAPEVRCTTVGFNYRLTKAQLAVGLTQLAKIDDVIARRLERFMRMQELLADVGELILPVGIAPGHGCHLYIVRLDTARVRFTRDALRSHLKSEYGVGTAVHYPAVWSWDVFRGLDHDRTDCPIAETACEQILSLPISPVTPFEDLEYVRDSLKQSIVALRGRRALSHSSH